MTKELKAIKLNMTQIFMDNGDVIPVTLVKLQDDITEELVDKPVLVTGFSKGKGFTGGMKKWNFAGAQATRGQSTKPRAPGSIGAQTPGRVFKGKKMAGRHGHIQVTIKGLKVVQVNTAEKVLSISGPVPGARNTELSIKVL